MPEKDWEDMTTAEKLDLLHENTIKLADAYNRMNSRLSVLAGHVRQAKETANEALKEAEGSKAPQETLQAPPEKLS